MHDCQVDCNNFFASCERLFRPDLKEKPVLVLSNNDGCVVARSQEVRAFGIPMGVPYFKVRDLVEKNNVVCFSSNFALYSNISQRILQVLSRYAPEMEVYSIDEAFLNLAQLPIDNFSRWGNDIRKTVQKEVGMPVSVGIAPTKTLAKMASGYAKKHQQTCVLDPTADQAHFKAVLEATKVGDVWGVGRQLVTRFEAAGVRNAWQLYQSSPEWLHAQLGITGTRMHGELHGEVAYPFSSQKAPQKSLMASRSFGHTIKNIHELETAVASFASQAAFRLRSHNQITAVFGLYLRFRMPDGSQKGQSAAMPLIVPTNDTTELVSAALELLGKLYDEQNGYKKAGVFAHSLSSAHICQTALFDQKSPAATRQRTQLMAALDGINKRYGSETIYIGSIDPKATNWHALKKRMSPAYTTSWSELPKVYAGRP